MGFLGLISALELCFIPTLPHITFPKQSYTFFLIPSLTGSNILPEGLLAQHVSRQVVTALDLKD